MEMTISYMDSIKQALHISSEWIYEYSTVLKKDEIQVYYHKTDNEALIINKSQDRVINLTEEDILVLSSIIRFYEDKFNTRNRQDAKKHKYRD